jgi:hypothetical protein
LAVRITLDARRASTALTTVFARMLELSEYQAGGHVVRQLANGSSTDVEGAVLDV